MLQQDHQWAFDIIYNAHWEHLYNHAYKRIGIQYIVEDALQNVFSRIWVKRHTLNIINIQAYLITSLMHECIRILSKTRHIDAFYQKIANTEIAISNQGDGLLIQMEILTVAYEYAATLSEKKRKLFLLHLKGYDSRLFGI